MLCRISEIKNVGTFTSCAPSSVGFDKITLIYGRNTYGKSTLGDIFYSLEKNQKDVITARQSIPEPENNGAQSIKLQFAGDGEKENHGISQFRAGGWIQGLRPTHKLKTFNDAFYHDHVFASRKLTRETKVNFSEFILGEQGVALANQIKELNAQKRKHASRKKVLHRDVFSAVGDIEDFLALPLPDDGESLQNRKKKLEAEVHELSKKRSDLGAIRKRPSLSEVQCDYSSLLPSIIEINGILTTTLDTHHEEARQRLFAHIAENFALINDAEHWIQQGLKYNKDESCQFCGQELRESGLALIDSYQKYFDESFERHDAFVKQELTRLGNCFDNDVFTGISKRIELNQQYWERYPDIQQFIIVKQELEPLSNAIVELLNAAGRELTTHRTDFVERAREKKAKPHYAIDKLPVSELDKLISALDNNLGDYSALVERINLQILQFKEHLEDAHINARLKVIARDMAIISRSLNRLEKKEVCEELLVINTSINDLSEQVPNLEQQLKDNQTAYLDSYFESINKYFTLLGSRHFLLKRQLDRSGHIPIYHLKVTFHNQDVPEADLDKIFSESDRRALGLSVFLASLDTMNDADLRQTVVVFDDPVTSFDDHRVSNTHRALIDLSERCEQIILLSHYREGISQFIKTYSFSDVNRVKLIEISKTDKTSSLVEGDFKAFTRMAHEDNREKIIDFIERRADSFACSLRLFLETEISLRFGKQLTDKQIPNDNLNNRITAMMDNNIITESVGRDLHRWREDLNPEHHIWVGDDIENKRTTAARFIYFVYHSLLPA